jgi:hypothetical protein
MIDKNKYNYALLHVFLAKTAKMHKKTSIESTTYNVNFCNKTLKLNCNLLKNCVQ